MANYADCKFISLLEMFIIWVSGTLEFVQCLIGVGVGDIAVH